MLTDLFLKGRLRHDLDPQERERIDAAVAETVVLKPRTTLVRSGEWLENSYYLVSGTMLRHIDAARGKRQIVGLSVVGDFVDLHGYAMKRIDHGVSSLDEVTVARVPHKAISELVREMPHLARVLWFSTLLDAAMHREWIFRLGRLNAEGRIAQLISELCARLAFVNKFDGRRLTVPLLQSDYAEACGISLVHANRSFRQLKDRGLLDTLGDGYIEIRDLPALNRLSEFKPDYLYGDGNLQVSALVDG
ncbi:Crp/Fnr family transcriptional regulator [Tsuneonella sp. HG222]